MSLAYPQVSEEKRQALGAAKRELEGKTKAKKS
jgi:hypothetical protein